MTQIDYSALEQTAEAAARQPSDPSMDALVASVQQNPAAMAQLLNSVGNQQAATPAAQVAPQAAPIANGSIPGNVAVMHPQQQPQQVGHINYEALGQIMKPEDDVYVKWQFVDEILGTVQDIEIVQSATDRYPPKDGRAEYLRYVLVEPSGKQRIIDNKKSSMMKPMGDLQVQVGDFIRIECKSKGGQGKPYRFRVARLDANGLETDSAE